MLDTFASRSLIRQLCCGPVCLLVEKDTALKPEYGESLRPAGRRSRSVTVTTSSKPAGVSEATRDTLFHAIFRDRSDFDVNDR